MDFAPGVLRQEGGGVLNLSEPSARAGDWFCASPVQVEVPGKKGHESTASRVSYWLLDPLGLVWGAMFDSLIQGGLRCSLLSWAMCLIGEAMVWVFQAWSGSAAASSPGFKMG